MWPRSVPAAGGSGCTGCRADRRAPGSVRRRAGRIARDPTDRTPPRRACRPRPQVHRSRVAGDEDVEPLEHAAERRADRASPATSITGRAAARAHAVDQGAIAGAPVRTIVRAARWRPAARATSREAIEMPLLDRAAAAHVHADERPARAGRAARGARRARRRRHQSSGAAVARRPRAPRHARRRAAARCRSCARAGRTSSATSSSAPPPPVQ